MSVILVFITPFETASDKSLSLHAGIRALGFRRRRYGRVGFS